MGRSKLRAALAAEKGTNIQVLKQKKKFKLRQKSRAKLEARAAGDDDSDDDDEHKEDKEDGEEWEDEDEEEDDDESDEEEHGADLIAAIDDSDESDSEVEMEAKIERTTKTKPARKTKAKGEAEEEEEGGEDDDEDDEDDEEEDEEDEEDGEVNWSDLDEEDRADLVVRTRQTINNKQALTAALARIRLPRAATGDASVPFSVHQSVVSAEPTADAIPDIQDDVVREKEMYRQSLEAVVAARSLLRAEGGKGGVPFTRPNDYFAEMVKDDGHMDKVKAKLIEAATAQKASAEAKRQRELKKFGKQVQQQKLQERAKAKKETLNKIQQLKKRRQENGGAQTTNEASDLFDVAVENEIATGSKRKASGTTFSRGSGSRDSSGGPGAKRQKKNDKYGFGGKKKYAKSGDALSSGDLSGFNGRRPVKKASTKPLRPGKARRQAGRR